MAVPNGDVDGDDDAETKYTTVGVNAAELQRYTQVTIQDDEVVIYDEENENAWIQATFSVSLGSMA